MCVCVLSVFSLCLVLKVLLAASTHNGHKAFVGWQALGTFARVLAFGLRLLGASA